MTKHYWCYCDTKQLTPRRVRLGVDCRFTVSRTHIQWLGLYAFRKVLAKKQSMYVTLLAAIDAKLRQQQYQPLAEQLAAVVQEDKSAVFDEIMY